MLQEYTNPVLRCMRRWGQCFVDGNMKNLTHAYSRQVRLPAGMAFCHEPLIMSWNGNVAAATELCDPPHGSLPIECSTPCLSLSIFQVKARVFLPLYVSAALILMLMQDIGHTASATVAKMIALCVSSVTPPLSLCPVNHGLRRADALPHISIPSLPSVRNEAVKPSSPI